jgi:disulfide bond formation protein DsbB
MTTLKNPTASTAKPDIDRANAALLLSWIVALTATLAVLFVGEVMGQSPCNLCWFQRSAMFPLAVILGIASFNGDTSVWRYGLPLAVAGWVVAAFHTALYYGILPASIEPCGDGPSCIAEEMVVTGIPIPLLSLGAFSFIAISLSMLIRRGHA